MLYKFKDWTFPFQIEKTIEGLKLADWNDINVISSHHHHRRIKSRHCVSISNSHGHEMFFHYEN